MDLKLLFAFMLLNLLIASVNCEAAASSAGNRWLDRVIPLPKKITISGSIRIPMDRIRIESELDKSPQIDTALDILNNFALNKNDTGDFVIRLELAENPQLKALPNNDQAYTIKTSPNGKGLTLTAITPTGILYAARTLEQLVDPPIKPVPDIMREIPLVEITDWPDLPERGQWGGNSESDLAWTSKWKLNVLEANAQVEVDKENRPAAKIDKHMPERGYALGVKVVPFIVHLEQIAKYGGLMNRKDIISTPAPSKPLPSDYVPGLCMSSPSTLKLVEEWLEKTAEIERVSEIMVWLSEDRSQCFCEKCLGKEPYELEVSCVVGAYREVRKKHPDLRLRLLTTQGSYPVNDKVLTAVPEDVRVSYYDGGRTYDSSQTPMIYPLLENYAKTGRWLGVYPQITHSWRTVFPWTGPQFIQYRSQEFVDKKLNCMIGYAVPSNRYHEFNVMAMAEWTWNARGRSPEDFCRAYAFRTINGDANRYSRWAILAGEAGWALAESKLMLTAIYNPSFGLGSNVPFDHRFEKAGISDITKLDEMIRTAEQALKLAEDSKSADMISESKCTLAGLEAFAAIGSAFPLLSSKSLSRQEQQKLSDALDRLDYSSQTLRTELLVWGDHINRKSGGKYLPGRLFDTAFALLPTCDAFRSKAVELGVPDRYPTLRMKRIKEWSVSDFSQGPDAVIRLDVTDAIPESGGIRQIGFGFIDSAYGVNIKAVKAVVKTGDSESVTAETPDPPVRVSRWERLHEMRLDIPARPSGSRLFIEVPISGLPADAPSNRRTCSGWVGIRTIHPNPTYMPKP